MKLPPELRALSYDFNSVLHFNDRDFSKNGHRTIIFRDINTKQNRVGLTSTDLRKIEIVYGPECQKRDRQAKIDLCQHYPGIIRRKRNIELESTRSLRVNPDITPPVDISKQPHNLTEEISNSIKELGIVDEVQNIIEDVYKLTALALKNARIKYCNVTKEILRTNPKTDMQRKSDILGIIEVITSYSQGIVDNALRNLTEFCETSVSIDKYIRSKCSWYDIGNNRCQMTYKSTKSGPVKYSTQHRPLYYQSTKHKGRAAVYNYDDVGFRTGVDTDNSTDNKKAADRRKRSVTDTTESVQIKNVTTTVISDVTPGNGNTSEVQESANATKTILRMATIIHSKKKKNYAPIMRRLNRPKVAGPPSDLGVARTGKFRYEDATPSDTDTEINGGQIEIVEKKIEIEPKRPKKLRKVPRTVKLSAKNKEFYNQRKWPDNIVKYVITDYPKYNIKQLRSRLEKVNNILKRETCVRLEEISVNNEVSDYLVLDTSPDYVTGRVGGKQIFGSVELFGGGQHRQHAAMMVMAMLGFYFEVSRHDRDKYIRVHYRHIRPDKLHHFEKIRSDATLPLPYDYKSATHPAWQFWRKLGKKGISAVATFKNKDPKGKIMKSLGQNKNLLSKYDLVKINSVYGIDCFLNQRRMKIKSDVSNK